MSSHDVTAAVDCKDVRSTECRETIAKKIAALCVGEKLHIEAEHDPLPAVMPLRLEREHPGEFVWAYGETNSRWELEIERVRDACHIRNPEITSQEAGDLMKSLSFEDRYKAI